MMGVSTSGYYAWRDRPPSKRTQVNQELVTEIRAIHAESRQTYGSPRIHAELFGRCFQVSKNRVIRLMRAEDIRSKRKRKRKITTNSQHTYPIVPNLLQRDFQAKEPNQKSLGDITFIPTTEGANRKGGCVCMTRH